MSVEKRSRAYLELATKDVEAAELLLVGGNRYSAYHVQQAVEKITKALLIARGIEAGIEYLSRSYSNDSRSTMSGLLGCCRSLATRRTQLHSGIRPQVVVFPPIRQDTVCDVTPPRCVSSSR
jgi:HEPN domain-containing protein